MELSWNKKYDIQKFEHIVVNAHCPGKLLVTADGPNIICDCCLGAFTEPRFRRHKCPTPLEEGPETKLAAETALNPEIGYNDERKKRLWDIKSVASTMTTVRSTLFTLEAALCSHEPNDIMYLDWNAENKAYLWRCAHDGQAEWRNPLKPDYSTVFNLHDVVITRNATALKYESPHKAPLLHNLSNEEKKEAMWAKNMPRLDHFDWMKDELKLDDIPKE